MSGWTSGEKTFVSQNFLLSWIFSDTGRKFFKISSYFVRLGLRKSTLSVQRYFVTKNKMFQLFPRKVYFFNSFRILIGKICTFEKKNCLVSKNSVLRVQGNVLGENFCIKKLFLCKILSDFERKFFGIWRSWFRQGCHHSILLLPRNVSEKIFSKKKVFLLFPNLDQDTDFRKNIRMIMKNLFYVSGG